MSFNIDLQWFGGSPVSQAAKSQTLDSLDKAAEAVSSMGTSAADAAKAYKEGAKFSESVAKWTGMDPKDKEAAIAAAKQSEADGNPDAFNKWADEYNQTLTGPNDIKIAHRAIGEFEKPEDTSSSSEEPPPPPSSSSEEPSSGRGVLLADKADDQITGNNSKQYNPVDAEQRKSRDLLDERSEEQKGEAAKHEQLAERDERVVAGEDTASQANTAANVAQRQLNASAGGGAAALAGLAAANDAADKNTQTNLVNARNRKDTQRREGERRRDVAANTKQSAITVDMTNKNDNYNVNQINKKNEEAQLLQNAGMPSDSRIKRLARRVVRW